MARRSSNSLLRDRRQSPRATGRCRALNGVSVHCEAVGFTLIEVVIGTAILALALGSTIAVISHSSVYQADLRLRAQSSQILQQRVEELRTMSWSEVTNAAPTFTSAAGTHQIFSGFVNISNYQSFGTTSTVVRATVTVVWTNRHSRITTNTITTLISNGGLNKM